MFLLYVDESGKSGLNDPTQPYFVLAGVVVKNEDWRAIETAFEKAIEAIVPRPGRPPRWELHMADIANGQGHFKATPRRDRRRLCDAVLDLIDEFDLTLIATIVDKKGMQQKREWAKRPPEDWAYEFLVERYQHLLRRRQELGIVVGDEQKGAEALNRTSHALWRRSGTSALRKVDRIVETVFFLPSHHSLMLQLADGVAYWCNRAMRAAAARKEEPPEWTRLSRHLDALDNGKRVGFKLWPD
ncbi:MAG TPA: DUF3800 domain-containing protein [Candidatus Dormibacteraeota bacterium]